MKFLKKIFGRSDPDPGPIPPRTPEDYLNDHISDIRALYPDAELVVGFPVTLNEWYTVGDYQYYAEGITPMLRVWRRPA